MLFIPSCIFMYISITDRLVFKDFIQTESVWLGVAFAITVLVTMCMRGLPKRAAIVAMLGGCLIVGLVKGPELVSFKREFSAAETEQSTYMRAAFAYVSLQMFKDKPITGSLT